MSLNELFYYADVHRIVSLLCGQQFTSTAMWSSILCLSFVTMVSSAPISPFFNYLPHYGNPRPGPSAQGTNDFFSTNGQPAFNAPISMEIVFPPQFQGSPVGGAGAGPAFPSQGFIKYSLPKVPGRKSVEIYYPYDFTQQRQMMPSVPMMPAVPQLPGLVTFDNPPHNVPQQQPPRASPPQSNDPHPQIMHDQPVQTGQTPINL
uniref:Secretory calcium-binding phosphoprotein 5 n=1 Tax=Astyanax mexicanus TaxID=7994 RepID=A0A3B1JXS7_ASTMX